MLKLLFLLLGKKCQVYDIVRARNKIVYFITSVESDIFLHAIVFSVRSDRRARKFNQEPENTLGTSYVYIFHHTVNNNNNNNRPNEKSISGVFIMVAE